MSASNIYIAVCLILAGLASACLPPENPDENDRLLAEVQNHSLYLSELDGMFPEGTTARDSKLIINAYVNRWVREALLLTEAERNLPQDLNIDELVRDYRASLIRHNYERVMVEELLDSTITREELRAFYEKNKAQYRLESPILRCYFAKIPLPVNREEKFNQWWENPEGENYDQLLSYCNENAVAHQLEDSVWYEVEEIALQLPGGLLNADNVRSIGEIIREDENFRYYLRVLEVKDKSEIAPLSFIEEQARKVILHNRKIRLLEEKKEDMYERGLRRNTVKIYTEVG
ncbi:MAG: peptidylprolyl isomerase [Saprospiraceae bacterium]|nr:peptidylprolyl isomerase [Saprospiraceae bacterium]